MIEIVTALAGAIGVMIGVMLFLAFVVETLVEAVIAPIVDHVAALKPHRWLLMYVGIGVGVFAAFLYQLDVVYVFALFAARVTEVEPLVPMTGFGIAVTGIAIGKGSNYIHQLISKFFPARTG